MPTKSDEQTKDTHGIVLKPRKQKGLTRTNPGMKKAMNALWGAVRASSASRRKAKSARARAVVPQQSQRAAVRVTYVGPKTKGLWKAHGTYLQRESATGKDQAGFDERAAGVRIAETLDKWQNADDPRLYKIILSPEFGEKIDLERYTRDVMKAIQQDVSAPLEWVAVAHYNTDHPHVHVALRSVTRNDKELHFPKDYIRTSIRAHAQAAATQQIGYRAQHDVDRARQKEIGQQRLTAIDRNIARLRPAGHVGPAFEVTINPRAAKTLRSDRQADVLAMGARLRHLEGMGLAQKTSDHTWIVQASFTDVLKSAQLAGDRQRTFARQMAKASDTNLPFVSDTWNAITDLSGRVLGHGEDEGKGKHFMLIEGVDGRIHHLPHRKETEALRADKELRANEFVRFTKQQGRLRIEQYGDSAALLKDPGFLEKQPTPEYGDEPRPGWLGAYDQAVMLHRLSQETQIMKEQQAPSQGPKPDAPIPASPSFKKLLQSFPRAAAPNITQPQQIAEGLNGAVGTLSGPREKQPVVTPQPVQAKLTTPDEIVKSLKARLTLPEVKTLSSSTNKATGDVTYSLAGKPALTDSGKNITVFKSDALATRIALEIAVEKYGKTIDATGTPEFQAQLIDAAVAMRTDLTFTDAGIQAKYQKAQEVQRLADLQKAQGAQPTGPVVAPTNAPILLSKQQAIDYLTKSNQQQNVPGLVRDIENDQKFQIDIEGGKISYNDIEMGGEEGRALYANVTPEGREKIMEKLAIDDAAAVKQAQLWVKEQTEKRQEVEKQLTAIQEEATPLASPVASQIDSQPTALERRSAEYAKAVAIAGAALGDQPVEVVYAEDEAGKASSPYKGEIIGATDDYVLMKQDDSVVLHEKDTLARVPETGKKVQIDYGNGKQKANVVTLGMKRNEKELEL